MRISKRIWLLGNIIPLLTKSNLAIKLCLKAFLYDLSLNKIISQSGNIVATEVENVWNEHGMPCVLKNEVREKLKLLHNKKYNLIMKNKLLANKNQRVKENYFKSLAIQKLFDIAHYKFDSLFHLRK